MRRRSLALLALAGSLLATSAPPGRSQEESELLVPGPSRERSIGAEEVHAYRAEIGEGPVLILVEQQGIDLVVEAREPSGQEPLTASAPNNRWGPEVLLLSAGPAAEYRVEIRPRQKSVLTGRYTIRAETIDSRRAAAFQVMSRAGQLALGPSESRSEALSAYREALASWRALGDRRWEAEALMALGQLEQQAGDLRAAVADCRHALALWRELSEPRRVAAALDALGLALQSSGEIEGARAAMQEAFALWGGAGERSEEEGTRGDLCLLDLTSGSLPAALACYDDLLVLYRGRDNPRGEATVLNSLGGVYDLMGEPDAALDRYGKALVLWRALGERAQEARTLGNIAVVHRALGEWQEALRVYGQVREILATSGDRSQQATLFNNVGFTYLTLGEPERARTLLEDARKLRREMGERTNEIITLNNLGLAWRHLGDTAKALDHHRQALELAVALGDPRQEAMSRLRLGEAHLERGDAAAALRELGPALAHFRDTGLRGREAQALQAQGRALAQSGRPSEALPTLQEVLERCRTLRDRAGEAEALHALATVERSIGLLDQASVHAEEAVARVEELRTGFVSPDLRAAFLATRRRAYELRVDLLMDRHTAGPPGGGHDRTAFEISEQARARSLLDALRRSTGGPGGSAPSALLERRQSLRRRVSAKADQQLKQGGAKAEALGKEVEALLAELDTVEAEIRRLDPRYAAVSAPPALSVEDIAGLLDPGTLLLEYSLGEERSILWAVDPKGLRSFFLPSRKEIEGLARQAYDDLSTVGSGAERQREVMEALGQILLGPVWEGAAPLQRLIVVPDGALHILAFASLRVPEPGRDWDDPGGLQPLLERQEVVYLPSATTLALQRQRLERRSPAPKWVAILADPVFSPHDPRLAATSSDRSSILAGQADGPLPGFERLPSSRSEAEAIAALAPAGQVWIGLDFKASREAVLSGDLHPYRVLHFATHGVADTRNPELSGLVLSLVDAAGKPREGFLGLSDIHELDLAADLVVLSGCRTALGKEVRGEGLMNLTRGFLYAGVPRVVGTLWPVQDRTTKELMSRFYRAMWQGGLPPASALREAQRSMIRDDHRYRDPYSWAGFVLQGDWR